MFLHVLHVLAFIAPKAAFCRSKPTEAIISSEGIIRTENVAQFAEHPSGAIVSDGEAANISLSFTRLEAPIIGHISKHAALALPSALIRQNADGVSGPAPEVLSPHQNPDVHAQESDKPVSENSAIVTSTISRVVACWNVATLLGMSLLGLKVLSDPSDPGAREISIEDMSIGRILPWVFWWCASSCTLVCFNKFLFLTAESGGFGFPFPMTLSWWHMVVAFASTHIIRCVRPDLMPALEGQKLDLRGYLTFVLPIGLFFGAYLSVGNSVYLYLPVSFVQMLRSAGPMFVFAASVAFGLERLTLTSVVALFIVVIGVVGTSVGEVSFSSVGLGLQLIAFVLDSLRAVLTKMMMSSLGAKLDPLSGLYYYAPICIVFLFWPMVYFEGTLAWTAVKNAPPSLLGLIVLNGLVAFNVNLSLLTLLSKASATTVSMLGVVRDIGLTFGAAILFHTQITKIQVLGYLCTCVGIKMWDEMKARPRAFYKALGVEWNEQLPTDQET